MEGIAYILSLSHSANASLTISSNALPKLVNFDIIYPDKACIFKED